MRSAGSWRGVDGGSAPAGNNDTLIDSGIATLERATSMDREGKLEGMVVPVYRVVDLLLRLQRRESSTTYNHQQVRVDSRHTL